MDGSMDSALLKRDAFLMYMMNKPSKGSNSAGVIVLGLIAGLLVLALIINFVTASKAKPVKILAPHEFTCNETGDGLKCYITG